MLHGGTRSGTNSPARPMARGLAQYFCPRGYAVYVVDSPARPSGFAEAYGPSRVADGESAQRRYLQQSNTSRATSTSTHAMAGQRRAGRSRYAADDRRFPAEIENFTGSNSYRDALVGCRRIGPAILLTHSQGGAVGWPVADARPDSSKPSSASSRRAAGARRRIHRCA